MGKKTIRRTVTSAPKRKTKSAASAGKPAGQRKTGASPSGPAVPKQLESDDTSTRPTKPNPKLIGKQHIFLKPPSPAESKRFQSVVKAAYKALMQLPGVNHVSGGLRFKNGYSTGELAVRIETGNEKDKQALRKFARKLGIKKFYGKGEHRYRLDIIIRKVPIVAHAEGDKIRARMKGTLGAAVKQVGIPTVYWLTAAHVVTAERPSPSQNVDVFPDASTKRIGHVFGSSLSDCANTDTVDAALITPDPAGGPMPPDPAGERLNSAALREGDEVVMIARTGKHFGHVSSMNISGKSIDQEGDSVLINNHFEILGTDPNNPTLKPVFGHGGDSGATIRTRDGTIVACYRAVDEANKIGYACDIELVKNTLRLDPQP